MFALRDYQTRVVEAAEAALARGTRALALQMATGAGKTVVLAELARRRLPEGRCLFLAHRGELVAQAAATLQAHLRVPVTIEQGGERSRFCDPVVVASVPTVGRAAAHRLQRLDPDGFATVFVDEIHHAAMCNRTWLAPLQWAGILDDDRHRTGDGPALIGCSATLRRADGLSLAGVLEEVVADVPLSWLIAQGYLAPLRPVQLHSRVNLDQVPVKAGDFVAAELERTVNVRDRNQLAVEHYRRQARERQFLAFVPGVAHAHRLAADFREAGIPCAAVDGTTPKPERQEVLRAFRRGELCGLVNVQCYTEGTDLPMIGAVYLLRPTRSSLVYAQMVGRGTRRWSAASDWHGAALGLAPSKPDCLLVDMVDVCRQHRLVGAASLVGEHQPAACRFEPTPLTTFEREESRWRAAA